ncbi:MAG: nuclear transport factor 2 family protein [Dehalococcoidales bacterium]|nr:nuclear transport factor 2 family protein [Dehalococcoidales bacterium]
MQKQPAQMVTARKKIVNEFFRLIGSGKFKDVLPFFSPDCQTHNPYIIGGMNALMEAMIAASKEMTAQVSQPDFTVKYLLADGDMVAAYTQLLNSKGQPGAGGLRQTHLFRFEGEKIVEYWDITQQILPGMPNAVNAF